MSDANERIRDETLYFMALLLRYREGVAIRYIKELNDKSLPDLLKLLYSELQSIPPGFSAPRRRSEIIALISKLRQVQIEYRRTFYSTLKEEMVQLGQYTAEHEGQLLRSVMPVSFASSISLPNTGVFGATVTHNSFNGQNLRDWLRGIDEATLNAIQKQVEIGLSRGDTPSKIITAIRGTARNGFRDGIYNTTRNNTAVIVRSLVNHVANRARQLSFEQNAEVIASVQWVSTLDERTSDICQNLDGQTFPLDSGPRPPAHLNCRSTIIAVTKSWRELGIDLDELPEGTRASINGQIPASLTYNEYFGRLSPRRQTQVRRSERDNVQVNTLTLDQFKDLTR